MSDKNKRKNVVLLLEMIVLTAVIVALQTIKVEWTVDLINVLCVVPVLLGCVISDNLGGAWIGFVFGLCAMFRPSVAGFIKTNVSAGVCACLMIGTIAGVLTSIVYNRLAVKKNRTLATFAAAFVWPAVRNLLIIVLYFLFFRAYYMRIGLDDGSSSSLFFKGTALLAVVEFALGAVISPIIAKLVKLNEKKLIKAGDEDENNGL
ncbi:MAG: hypothetical protein IJU39_02835 [Clostridia bacterium]|nr:hypothetical protein [Clostridia bacterium]